MFLNKKLFLDPHEKSNFTKYENKKKKHPVLKIKRRQDKIRKKNYQVDGETLNYKQKLINKRITLKHGIFPHAIHTNLLSKCSKPVRGKNNITHKKKPNVIQKHSSLEKRYYKENSDSDECHFEPDFNDINETETIPLSFFDQTLSSVPVLKPLAVSPIYKSSNTNRYSDSVTSIPDEIIHDEQNKTSHHLSEVTPVNTRIVKKQTLLFNVYNPHEAQQILMYKEFGEALNRTMIIQRMAFFEDFPGDSMEILHDKLWKIRSSRDYEFNENLDDYEELNESSKMYAEDDHSIDSQLFPSDLQKDFDDFGTPRINNSVEFFPQENKLHRPQDVSQKEEVKDVSKIRKNENHLKPLKEQNNVKADDKFRMSFNRQNNNKPKRRLQKKPLKNQLFHSTIIPTSKICQNLTLHPLEFLENISNEHHSNKKVMPREELLLSPEEKIIQNKLYLDPTVLSFPQFAPENRFDYQHNNLSGDDLFMNCKKNETGISAPYKIEKYNLHNVINEFSDHSYDNKISCGVPVINQCNEKLNKPAIMPCRNYSSFDETFRNSQNLDFMFPLSTVNKTPEMKYYPHRLY